MAATTTKPAYTVRWMEEENERNHIDLVEAVEELDVEFNTQYVKDKIDSTTGAGAVERATKRARKKYTLLMRINTLMRDGLLEAVKNKTLLSHIKNKEYVQTEIEALNKFPASYATLIIPLTCIQLIIDIFTVMAKRVGSGKASFQALCTPPDPSSVSFAAFEKQHQEKVPSFNMHVTDANMHVTVPTCDFAKITCQHLWQSLVFERPAQHGALAEINVRRRSGI
jgi:hypothetical protein